MQITSVESGRASPLSFSSLLSFFLDFWWNFRAQMRREGEGWTFYRGDTPVARGGGGGGGDRPPCRPWAGPSGRSPVGWATGPCRPLGGRQGLFFPGTSLRFKKNTLKAC